MTFYVGNLSPQTTREHLAAAFKAHGEVGSVIQPAERMSGGTASGTHRGYAFVVMRGKVDAGAAIAALHGRTLQGQAIEVRIAIPQWTPSYVR